MTGARLNCCPFCREIINPADPGLGDTNCPGCGRRLWFIADRSATWFFTNAADLDRIQMVLDEQRKMLELGFDYLDIVEIMMELEERLPEP